MWGAALPLPGAAGFPAAREMKMGCSNKGDRRRGIQDKGLLPPNNQEGSEFKGGEGKSG